ncbi:hypothetical protein CWI38_0179p0050 [Hamiltosporidium tvaerminnensis]|uniref:Uncharacterized protein n=1 Tax=Hamiltosporidium tvaerminnensis TaxID=1176355 RepID=A0A4Q9LZW5_9MICR|nr:hypothetical protein CWI38_0179p0050 [Hamiltosporidium tvaerminnensis]
MCADIRTQNFILDISKKKIKHIELLITSRDSLKTYVLCANKLVLIYMHNVEIVSYVMAWDGSKRNAEESLKSSEMEVIEISEMLLKIKKSITPHISEEGSTLDEPTIQINKESDLEGETFW